MGIAIRNVVVSKEDCETLIIHIDRRQAPTLFLLLAVCQSQKQFSDKLTSRTSSMGKTVRKRFLGNSL